MGAHEALEHAEHTEHAHGAKHMGVTMAVLGVLIAFSAAMVGSQRQELMTTLLDQSWAHSSWVAASVKSANVRSDLQKLRGANAASNPALPQLVRLDSDYTTETNLAKEWDDVCDPLIDAHFDAAEGYEHAQLIAELALIIASVAILLNNRMTWFVSLVVGVICIGFLIFNFIGSRSAIAEHHEKVEAAEHAYEEHSENDLDSKGHNDLLNEVDPGGKIRASFPKEEKASHQEAEKPKTEESKSEE